MARRGPHAAGRQGGAPHLRPAPRVGAGHPLSRKEQPMSEPATPTLARDVRLDQIGFVGELGKLHADKLKDGVKARLLSDAIDRAAGDYFEGLLVASRPQSIDAGK